MDVPAPRVKADASGRVLLRLPRDLHGALVRRAEIEGVSLNTYLVSSLSVAVGQSLTRRTVMATPTYASQLATYVSAARAGDLLMSGHVTEVKGSTWRSASVGRFVVTSGAKTFEVRKATDWDLMPKGVAE
jgi:hypothetical protein